MNEATNHNRLLLVDDEATFHRFFIADFANFTVHSAYNADGALQELAAHPQIDLAVVDLSFDGGNTFEGLDLIATIHRQLPQLPIMAISKYQSVTYQTDTLALSDLAIKAGAKRFKSKAEYSISGWQRLFKKWTINTSPPKKKA